MLCFEHSTALHYLGQTNPWLWSIPYQSRVASRLWAIPYQPWLASPRQVFIRTFYLENKPIAGTEKHARHATERTTIDSVIPVTVAEAKSTLSATHMEQWRQSYVSNIRHSSKPPPYRRLCALTWNSMLAKPSLLCLGVSWWGNGQRWNADYAHASYNCRFISGKIMRNFVRELVCIHTHIRSKEMYSDNTAREARLTFHSN